MVVNLFSFRYPWTDEVRFSSCNEPVFYFSLSTPPNLCCRNLKNMFITEGLMLLNLEDTFPLGLEMPSIFSCSRRESMSRVAINVGTALDLQSCRSLCSFYFIRKTLCV